MAVAVRVTPYMYLYFVRTYVRTVIYERSRLVLIRGELQKGSLEESSNGKFGLSAIATHEFTCILQFRCLIIFL
jgi:hypothetical protein